MASNKILKGGEFLIKEIEAQDVFIPEEFNEEQRMIAQTINEFLEAEVYPNLDKIDNMEDDIMPKLLKKAGESGLLGISVPEEYEGFGQSFLTAMLASEAIGSSYSFSVAFMAHIGIGSYPLLYYGNEEQKKKYLSKLATGEFLASYCLTEPNAGSDANSGKTKAVLSEDGKHYILNGQKMWITNGGFADLFVVFAKIDNDRILSAFLVERDSPGLEINPEEKKMGIKGSSTVPLFFNDVKVPVENLLGGRGGGFRIALSILHIGRIKLGGNVLGSMKQTITQSVNYANEREQFGMTIANFGAIKFKLAEQVIRAFTTESALYRASKDIDDAIQKYISEGMPKEKAVIAGASQFAIEAALLKVLGSECQEYIVDEGVQIFGGMGFSAIAPMDRAYRDARISRIFEGTNEINRLLVVETTIKNGVKHDIGLFEQVEAVVKELKNGTSENGKDNSYYGLKRNYIRNYKKAILLVIGIIYEKFKGKFVYEQEIMMNVADMIIQLYAAESTLLRVEKLEKLKGEKVIGVYKDILDVFVYDAASAINKHGLDAVNSLITDEQQQITLDAIGRFTKVAPVNVQIARRRIADKLIEDNRYKFGF